MTVQQRRFDPYGILAALEGQRVAYVLIGGFARVIQGTEELTEGLDLAPSLRPENLHALTTRPRRARGNTSRPHAPQP